MTGKTELEQDKREEVLNLGRRIIVFIGPEGSGKTTIAKLLAEMFKKPYITTGDTIRDLAANDLGPLGDECREMFVNHSYLKGETLLRILVERFGREDTIDGLVLDGGLRTLEETIDFQSMIDEAGRTLPITVVYLQISDEVSFERLVSGDDARKRYDDTQEGVAARLAKFHYQLEERVTTIKKNWTLVEVDATLGIENVYGEVCQRLLELVAADEN